MRISSEMAFLLHYIYVHVGVQNLKLIFHLMKIMEFIIGYPEMIVAAICFFLLHHFSKKTLVPNWPLVGMLPSLLVNVHRSTIHNWLTEVLLKCGGTFLFKGPGFANMDILFTCDPANLRHMLSTNFANYPKGPEFNEVFDVLGDGILNTDLDPWKSQRKLALQLISHQKFQKFLVQTSCRKVESGLIPVIDHAVDGNLVVDLQDVFKRLMYDISMTLLVGSDPGCLSIEFGASPYVKALDDAEEALFYRHVIPMMFWKLQRLLGVGIQKKICDAVVCFDQLIARSIAAKRKSIEDDKDSTEEKGIDLLRSYMEEDVISGTRSDKFLRDTMITFISAGTTAVSAALTWFFWLVSQNPEVESKIVEEIRNKATSFSPQGNKVKMFNIEGLKGLVYLHAALCESLRLFPTVPFNHKRPLKAETLPSGHRVDPKTRIIPILYSVGRMESVWGKDCLEFKPERWIAMDGRIQFVPSYKFITFNLGPRSCLGKDITFTQMKMLAATVLYNYHVEAVAGNSICFKNSVVLYMKYGMKVRIARRV